MLKKYKKIIASILVLVCIYVTDFTLVHFNKRPIFVIKRGTIKDGGSTQYYGLGYKVIKWNIAESEKVDGKEVMGALVGYDISIFPFYQQFKDGPIRKLKFVPIESLNE
ncbi:hypothetical protein [Clostridium paridis]|uniref:Uncharacterized protein n=1 Tax=Clostridium paridis TaxID=2803863 RepID=A0A937K5C2_9CLOT|nr:hypothetical protein [Clostridium paridis]MBL4932160.1 hypothetical protein [Clostridium paridis]